MTNRPAFQVKLTPKAWWDEFNDHVNEYRREWKNLFEGKLEQPKKSKIRILAKASKNFTRIPGDFFRLAKSRFWSADTSKLEIDLEVEDRLMILRDARNGKLTDKNKKVYKQLAANELITEVNCRNLLRIKGLNIGQLYKLLTDFGCNIRPFFSEHRGENGGRWVMDNRLFKELAGNFFDKERDVYYVERMFRNVPDFLPWSRWTNSRTHGVIYQITNNDGETEFLAPTHIDSENALVAIKEVITGKKRREFGAIEYHRMPEAQGEAYAGSGLGELGCLVLIGIFKKAEEAKKVRTVRIKGMDKLSTSGSIARDDDFMWEVYRLAKGKVLE